jgi:hypothetical protein
MFFYYPSEHTFVDFKDKRALDVAGGKDEEGNNVQAWKINGSKAQ